MCVYHMYRCKYLASRCFLFSLRAFLIVYCLFPHSFSLPSPFYFFILFFFCGVLDFSFPKIPAAIHPPCSANSSTAGLLPIFSLPFFPCLFSLAVSLLSVLPCSLPAVCSPLQSPCCLFSLAVSLELTPTHTLMMGQGAIVCKSRASHRVLVTFNRLEITVPVGWALNTNS